MKPADRIELFRRLAELDPHPETELEYRTPFELLVAVILSAQATDVGVNRATRRLFPVANTPRALLDLGEDGLRQVALGTRQERLDAAQAAIREAADIYIDLGVIDADIIATSIVRPLIEERIAVAEIAAVGRASVLIPSPNVAENHQYHNAMQLQKLGAAVVVEEKELTGEKLIGIVDKLTKDPAELMLMGAKARALAQPDSLDKICENLDRLMKTTA